MLRAKCHVRTCGVLRACVVLSATCVRTCGRATCVRCATELVPRATCYVLRATCDVLQGCGDAATLSGVRASGNKSDPEASTAVPAPIRHCRRESPATEVILARRSAYPSRDRIVRTRDGGFDFPRQRSGSGVDASLQQARATCGATCRCDVRCAPCNVRCRYRVRGVPCRSTIYG